MVPQDAPPPDYYAMMQQLYRIGNSLNQIAQKAHTLNVIDVQRYDAAYRQFETAVKEITAAVVQPKPIGISFIKSYAAVCLEGAIIVLGCIIFSLFAATPPVVDPNAAAVSMVWSYVGELVFNMLILVGTVKMADRVVREMMGL